ncbi:hypothetical protein PoB_000655000 [Plakobranchus ocellatus]|uniref:Uncharacterized protein n=1 Tax=Plakobranchus ocellatus TaxID=259542 RepID=A0AAV3YAB7_9GAST|nr:hypothetical protein PoB_000655000 [Plakobranchus ocellatus]
MRWSTPGMEMETLRQLAIKTSTDSYWARFIHFLAISNSTSYKIKCFYPQTDYLCEPMKLLLNSSVPPSTDNSCEFRFTVAKQLVGGCLTRSYRARQKISPSWTRQWHNISHGLSWWSTKDLQDLNAKSKIVQAEQKKQEVAVLNARSTSIKTVSGSTMRICAVLQQTTNFISNLQHKPKVAT